MKKIEENFHSITDNIKNYTSATSLDMKIYWLKQIWINSKDLKSQIEDELHLGE